MTRTPIITAIATITLASGIAAAGSAAAEPTLTERLLQPGELAGFEPAEPPRIVRSAAEWAAREETGDTAREAARLRRLGFVAVASRKLAADGRGDREGLSWVMRLGSAEAARAELAHLYRGLRKQRPSTEKTTGYVCVIAIPGAIAFDVTGAGAVGHNVVFSHGPFVYLVGAGYAPRATLPPTRYDVIEAAVRVFERVSGHSS